MTQKLSTTLDHSIFSNLNDFFRERENSGFPEIEMADRTQFRDRRMWGGGGWGERVIYVNT